MISFDRVATGTVPFFVFAACVGLFASCGDENGDGSKGGGGTDSTGGTGDSGASGQAGDMGDAGDGGTGTGGGTGGTGAAGASGESGDGGMAGEPAGGSAGGGRGGNGGAAGRGMSGTAGASQSGNGGMGGSGGSTCMTVMIPLMNADFDDGAFGWAQYDTEAGAERPIVVTAASVGITAESAPNVAHLGGVNDAAAGMIQPVAIPVGAVTMTLTGYRRVTTQEASSAPIDVLTIQLYEDAETTTGLVGDFAVLSNEDASSDWVEFTGTLDVEAHAGDFMELDVFALTDGSLITEFYVDSLMLTAVVCR